MSRYRMSDGSVVDPTNASASWEEGTRWDGNNHISLATGSQWNHETLYRSRKGRYYVVSTSQWQGSTPSAEWFSNEEATRWLLANEHSPGDKGWPDELTPLVDKVCE
jgi:hypothetical protein